MNLDVATTKFDVESSKRGAEKALERWIIKYGNVCGIDTSHPECPRFTMTCGCDCIEAYQQAVSEFGELWIFFNDVDLCEAVFMAAYTVARQNISGKIAVAV